MYFDIDAHKDCFKTNKDEAYFWHGRTDGCGGQDNAMDIASQNNGQTLEMCMLSNRSELEAAGVIFEDKGNGKVSIDYDGNLEESNKFWEDCSKAFAEQASGNVYVIEGSDPRPNGQLECDYPSVYNRIEHPSLEQNQNVSGIVHINPSDGKVTGFEPINHNNTGQNESAQNSGSSISSGNVASTTGGGSHAPPITAADSKPQTNSEDKPRGKVDTDHTGGFADFSVPSANNSTDPTQRMGKSNNGFNM